MAVYRGSVPRQPFKLERKLPELFTRLRKGDTRQLLQVM